TELETEVESLDAQISEWTSRRNAKLAELASLTNILSPIGRVPQEILSEIFLFVCLSDDDGHDYDVFRCTYILSTVCVAWKITAYSTPQIW
ncbi:hypothetical protein BT96DRAFT_787981, partial [Gymnopus androsaceus JB14]